MPKVNEKNKDKKKRKKFTDSGLGRFMLIFIVYFILTGVFIVMLLTRIMGSTQLKEVENTVATAVTPVQNTFDSAVTYVSEYLRTLKLRGNLEKEYNNLQSENEQLVYDAMLAKELQIKLDKYEMLFDEISVNEGMNPVTCKVIGREIGNYFSVFTINKGSDNGINDYMAVTMDGALVGYTYNVSKNKADVRTIIDSEASIAGLIQTSRDQGTIRGTLGIDGTPMCRMYYLPDDHLPRPGDAVVTSGVGMSFPKGIPIGTVRESTRGMEENKQFIVVEPKADFQHIEYVIVLRYQPEAIEVTAQSESGSTISYSAVPTAVPVPTILIGNDTFVLTTSPSPVPSGYISPTPEPEDTPVAAIPTPMPTTYINNGEQVEYNVPNATEEPIEFATLAPTPTPTPTPKPLELTLEDD